MAKVKVIGIDNFISQTSMIGEMPLKDLVGTPIYEGAKIVADTVRAEIDTIPNREKIGDDYYKGITPVERAGLKYGFGVAAMQKTSGFWNVKIGFEGYNLIDKPNAMIARSLESGTSWLKKDGFLSRSYKKSKARAEAKMADVFVKSISYSRHK